MKIIEIQPLDNGAHRNQTGSMTTVPDGWAILPAGLDTPNFPFGGITVDDSTPPVVTSWTAGEIPDPEPEPDPEPTAEERLDELEPTQLDIIEAQMTYTAIMTDTLLED